MKRFVGDTNQSDITLCDQCAARYQEKGQSIDEPNGTCELCLFNEQAAICILCHQKTHHYQPYRDVPRFALDQAEPWQVKWSEFLGTITVNICRECQELGFAPVYAAGDWVELSNASEWLRPNLDLSKPPLTDIIEELRCRLLTGF